METMGDLLLDSNVEVRALAATTLSGLIRCSQRSAIKRLRVSDHGSDDEIETDLSPR